MKQFSFIGRPDGLGNRLEEVAKLEAICEIEGCSCNYQWTNTYPERSYDVHFRGKNVNICRDVEVGSDTRTFDDFKFKLPGLLRRSSAQWIKPTFSVFFDQRSVPIGVHIAGRIELEKRILIL